MWKKIELGKKAKKTKSSEDFKVLADQKEMVNRLTQEARCIFYFFIFINLKP